MANKRTRALTDVESEEIIRLIMYGFKDKQGKIVKPNEKVGLALVLQLNLAMRVGDIVKLRLSDIIKDGNRYRLNIIEQKTGKKRDFTVPPEIFIYLQSVALASGIKPNQRIIGIGVRQIQKHLKLVAEHHLGLENIGTHSFRKTAATAIYNGNDCDIRLVQTILQHASSQTTERYIGIQSKQIETALHSIIRIPC